MRRLISISMVAVLAGWLALPVAGAHFSPCDMKCCHRVATVPHCSHMGTSGNVERASEIHGSSSACPGKCCVKGRRVQFGLAAPGLSSFFLAVQIPPPFLSYLDLLVLPEHDHSGRAPPRTV
jgi:hypothetical protein